MFYKSTSSKLYEHKSQKCEEYRWVVKSAKESSLAFIVRIWVEPREIKDAKPIWRGVIEHVGSGEQVYFDQLEQIAIQVMPHIEAMGLKVEKPGP